MKRATVRLDAQSLCASKKSSALGFGSLHGGLWRKMANRIITPETVGLGLAEARPQTDPTKRHNHDPHNNSLTSKKLALRVESLQPEVKC